jgi:hypothetical protein
LGVGGGAVAPPDRQRLVVFIDDHPSDDGVAAQPGHRVGAQCVPITRFGHRVGMRTMDQSLLVDDNVDMGQLGSPLP